MEQRKHDLRDDVKAKIAPADTHSQMAGETDSGPLPQPPRSNMHETKPSPDGPLAEGQVTKSN